MPIATGLPEGKQIQIGREVGGKHVHLATPEVCVQTSDLYLDWTREPRLRFIAGDKDEEKGAMESAKLVGTSFLRDQLTRAPGTGSVTRRDFVLAPKGPLPSSRLACGSTDLCGAAILFDGQGRLLVLTDHSEGDCQHYGCRLYDPATKKLASPPLGESWGELDKVPAGACGLYHFDRSGKRFLIESKACTVGGTCQELGGTAIGWLGGGTDVGTDG